LEVDGVILTMYDSRSIMSRQVTTEIQRFFGEKVYKYPVPRNIKITEAPGFGIPISIHAPSSSGGAAYEKLAEEFIFREETNIQ
jgi:chromosome partitioning protein